jgi:transposase
VCGRHPDLAVDQRGATAHRLGREVGMAAHHLHFGLGVPVRKLPAVLQIFAGVTLTQGAITRDALKKAVGAIGITYRHLCASIRTAPYVPTDDTGWREDGSPRWLMAFVTDTATVYQIRARHRNDEVREQVPADYAGVLITDRGTSYDGAELAAVKKQKCLAHVLRSLSEVLEKKTRGARRFAKRLKAQLQQALALWHERRAGPVVSDFGARVVELKRAITDQLRNRRLRDRDNQCLLNELGRCHDAGSLVRFLDEPGIEPTNNRAERALRPAVIARKVAQCTKTPRGTRAFEVWTSVIETLSRTTPGPALLDAIVRMVHPAAPQPG